jgi:hypothetical protein
MLEPDSGYDCVECLYNHTSPAVFCKYASMDLSNMVVVPEIVIEPPIWDMMRLTDKMKFR